MDEQQIWSVVHMGVGGVALEDATPLDVLDFAMMIGTFSQVYGPITFPTPLAKNIAQTAASNRTVQTV